MCANFTQTCVNDLALTTKSIQVIHFLLTVNSDASSTGNKPATNKANPSTDNPSSNAPSKTSNAPASKIKADFSVSATYTQEKDDDTDNDDVGGGGGWDDGGGWGDMDVSDLSLYASDH